MQYLQKLESKRTVGVQRSNAMFLNQLPNWKMSFTLSKWHCLLKILSSLELNQFWLVIHHENMTYMQKLQKIWNTFQRNTQKMHLPNTMMKHFDGSERR